MSTVWTIHKTEGELGDRRKGKRQGVQGRMGSFTYTCRCEMSCPTVISSAIFWYRLWLFKTMLSRIARDR